MNDRFDALLQIVDVYKSQADRCEKSRAYLSGCVVLGAALEAGLLATAMCYPSQVRRAVIYRRLKGKPLEEWGLFDLLGLARELKWVPSKLPIGMGARASGLTPDKALKNKDVAYFADVVREMRNVIHPGRYWRQWRGIRIKKQHFDFCYEIAEIVYEHLYQKLVSSVTDALTKKSRARN